MNNLPFRRRLTAAILFFTVTLCGQFASACPTCKDSLTENYVAAYGYSILFMMSMPFIIFGALSAYFYYEVCKARKQQLADQNRDGWSRESLDGVPAAKA